MILKQHEKMSNNEYIERREKSNSALKIIAKKRAIVRQFSRGTRKKEWLQRPRYTSILKLFSYFIF